MIFLNDIPQSDISETVKKAIKNGDYEGWRIDEAKKMATAYESQYRIKLEHGKQEVEVIFDANGNILTAVPKE